jgi:hypothetical protein
LTIKAKHVNGQQPGLFMLVVVDVKAATNLLNVRKLAELFVLI